MMQLRPMKMVRSSGDGDRFYSPNRDIAYCWQWIVEKTATGLDKENWQKWFVDYFSYAGVTEDDLDQAIRAYVLYIGYCNDPEIKTPMEALKKAGWFETKESARIAVCMKLGQVMTCAFFPSIRESVSTDYQSFDKEMLDLIAKMTISQTYQEGHIC